MLVVLVYMSAVGMVWELMVSIYTKISNIIRAHIAC